MRNRVKRGEYSLLRHEDRDCARSGRLSAPKGHMNREFIPRYQPEFLVFPRDIDQTLFGRLARWSGLPLENF
jgi:hypothetical protein